MGPDHNFHRVAGKGVPQRGQERDSTKNAPAAQDRRMRCICTIAMGAQRAQWNDLCLGQEGRADGKSLVF